MPSLLNTSLKVSPRSGKFCATLAAIPWPTAAIFSSTVSSAVVSMSMPKRASILPRSRSAIELIAPVRPSSCSWPVTSTEMTDLDTSAAAALILPTPSAIFDVFALNTSSGKLTNGPATLSAMSIASCSADWNCSIASGSALCNTSTTAPIESPMPLMKSPIPSGSTKSATDEKNSLTDPSDSTTVDDAKSAMPEAMSATTSAAAPPKSATVPIAEPMASNAGAASFRPAVAVPKPVKMPTTFSAGPASSARPAARGATASSPVPSESAIAEPMSRSGAPTTSAMLPSFAVKRSNERSDAVEMFSNESPPFFSMAANTALARSSAVSSPSSSTGMLSFLRPISARAPPRTTAVSINDST